MRTYPGVVDLKVESLKEIPQIDVKVDSSKPSTHGVKPVTCGRTAAALVTGTEVGDTSAMARPTT